MRPADAVYELVKEKIFPKFLNIRLVYYDDSQLAEWMEIETNGTHWLVIPKSCIWGYFEKHLKEMINDCGWCFGLPLTNYISYSDKAGLVYDVMATHPYITPYELFEMTHLTSGDIDTCALMNRIYEEEGFTSLSEDRITIKSSGYYIFKR